MKRNLLMSSLFGIMLLPGIASAQRVENGASPLEDEALEIGTLKKEIKDAILKNDKKQVERLLAGTTIRFLTVRDFDALIGEAQKLLKVKESRSHSWWNWALMLGSATVIGWVGWPMFQRRTRALEDQLNATALSELHKQREEEYRSAKEDTVQIKKAWKEMHERKKVTPRAAPEIMGEAGKTAAADAQKDIDILMEQVIITLGSSQAQAESIYQMVERNAATNFMQVDTIVNDGTKKKKYLEKQRWSWGDWGLSTGLLAAGGYALFRGWWAPYAQRNRARAIVQALRDAKAMVKPAR